MSQRRGRGPGPAADPPGRAVPERLRNAESAARSSERDRHLPGVCHLEPFTRGDRHLARSWVGRKGPAAARPPGGDQPFRDAAPGLLTERGSVAGRSLQTAPGPPGSPREKQRPVETLKANTVKFSSNTVPFSTQKGALKTPRSHSKSPRQTRRLKRSVKVLQL